MTGTPMKSSQLQEVVAAGGEILGVVDEQVKLSGVVDKQVKVSDVVDGQALHSGQEGNEGHHSEDVDKQREVWDAMDENKQIWDAADKQRKLEKLQEKRKKQQERMQKKNNKMMDLEVKGKEVKKRRKKSARVIKGGGSPSATYFSQRVTRSPFVKSPSARSPGVNKLRSSPGVLAEVAASKRERSPSPGAESSPLSKRAKRAKPSLRSPSMSRSPSPTSSPCGGSTKIRRGRKVRRLTSVVWRDFNPHYDDGKLVEAECKHCNELLPAGQHVGTSGVHRHLSSCKIRSELHLIVQKLKSSVTSPHATVLKDWEFDHKKSRRLLARMIVLDEMPFSIVEYSGFVDFVKSLNPLFEMVSRNTIKDDIMKSYNQYRSAYCEGFRKYAGRVSLTSDMWTSNQTLGYMCVTVHFIDANWKLHQKIIRFCMLETPHNGVAMFSVLLKSLQEWNIEDKLFSITLDNASVNGSMVGNLRENLVILDPRFKYDFVKFRLEQAFGSDAVKHLGIVEAALHGLFKEYSSETSKSLNDSTQGEHIDEVLMEGKNPLADWDLHLSKKQRQPINELDRYLQEETFPRKDDFNILEWWALHSSDYPVLARIARDVLAVPASVVPSESAFSTGQRVISDYRSRLNSKTVEALICLQSWLKQFDSLADVVDDDDL